MTFKEPDAKMRNEPKQAYAAFLIYRDERDLNKAYNIFMQENPSALTTMKAFVGYASKWDWTRRCNDYDDQQALFTKQETRRMATSNALTAESMAEELYITCMEEMELKRGDMTHRDIAKYMDICQKINERWVTQPEAAVNVTVNNEIQTVDVPDDVLKALGRKLVEEEDESSI